MRRNLTFASIMPAALLALACVALTPQQARGQVRGVYPPGFFATNSGLQPEPGFSYGNVFLDYTFSKVKGPDGDSLPVNGKAGVLVDVNVFQWVSKAKILGANYSAGAGLAVANSSLTSARLGSIGGGSGLADSLVLPVDLGWHFERADIQAIYLFFAPTGRFNPGATDNTGSGHWTNAPASGQTIYLTKNKGTAISAFELYEFHTDQKGTDLHPGQTFNLDYSFTQMIPLQKDNKTLLQVGLIGYGQWQTTDSSGPGVNAIVAANSHYRVNAIGATANIILPGRKTALGFKYFNEFSNKSTVQGYSLQISGGITF